MSCFIDTCIASIQVLVQKLGTLKVSKCIKGDYEKKNLKCQRLFEGLQIRQNRFMKSIRCLRQNSQITQNQTMLKYTSKKWTQKWTKNGPKIDPKFDLIST